MGSSLSTTTGCSSSQMPTGECPALPCAYALVLFCSRSVLTDCDSGASVRSPAGREERVAFYETNDIAYIARPGHNVNRYTRAGRFKKASNMNFCLGVSRRVSALMQVCWSACHVAQGC